MFYSVLILLTLQSLFPPALPDNARAIHVFVALCDNVHQGIVPVPVSIGNGQDPSSNLYWGAGYGVRNYFEHKTDEWELEKIIHNPGGKILERALFKHKTKPVFLLADAYDGAEIKETVVDFLYASSGARPLPVEVDSQLVFFGGKADLLAYVGHNGLMDVAVDIELSPRHTKKREAIILACYSKMYFAPFITQSGAHPLLWTTHLMAPEAYTLEWAIRGWMKNETGQEIRERAARAYHHYQQCGINGARNLLVTGF